MALSKSVESQLSSRGVAYQRLAIDPHLTQEQQAEKLATSHRNFLRAVVLSDPNGTLLAIMRQSSLLDFSILKKLTQRNLRPVPLADSHRIYTDCDQGCVPPIQVAGIDQVLIDRSLKSCPSVVFESGRHGTLVQLDIEDFLALHPNAKLDVFTSDEQALDINSGAQTNAKSLSQRLTPDTEKQEQLKRLYSLPALPDIAHRIIQLKSDPLADAQKLADVIQFDPSLTAQVIRYAKSAYYNYQGDVHSVQEAISRVLGFDLVMNMAFGLSAGKSLKNPPNGPLGLNAFWKHATFCATLAQKLARAVPKSHRPNPSMAYLAGLLHNFGFLLLGHLFQPEFFLLNKLYAANPNSSIQCIERHALGMGSGHDAINMGHAELGSWLMDHWNLSGEIVASVKYHHDPDYAGDHFVYPVLINIINSALGIYDIGDDRRGKLDEQLCARIDLDPTAVLFELDKLIAEREQIESIVMQFVS